MPNKETASDTTALLQGSQLLQKGRADVFRQRAPSFPLCGIAGIDASNAGEAVGAGADGVAVISALSLQADPQAAARALRAVVDAALAQRKRR